MVAPCHIVTLILQEACIPIANLSPCSCPCLNQQTWSCRQLDAWPQSWLSPRRISMSLATLVTSSCLPGTSITALESLPSSIQPKKTKPNLRFHLMLSTDSVDITAESEETVSLHPSFTQMLSQCGSPEETKKPKVGKKPKVANTSKIPAKVVQRRSQRISERIWQRR